ncbi:Protein NPC2 like protein [Trachymyrmex cornetzi]|uniref:Protein NPC2 like protein n=1 Tax=Trachymyrmex cornetzi TaxID=471704 RepID=A0A195EFX3_9HYME|nr:Protein NPC2 like protein [Trachymyrmex cornetzi]
MILGDPFEDANQISISDCDKPECLLKQGSTIYIRIQLVPNRDIQNLINDVSALLFNKSLPFVGVDGTNACNNIYNVDGSKADCPLQKGKEYVYENSFSILRIYPKVPLIVRYALREGNDIVICFEVPAKITK